MANPELIQEIDALKTALGGEIVVSDALPNGLPPATEVEVWREVARIRAGRHRYAMGVVEPDATVDKQVD